jgi:hypothetical protein
MDIQIDSRGGVGISRGDNIDHWDNVRMTLGINQKV